MTGFSLPTRNGSIELDLADGSKRCVGECGVKGGGLMEVVVHAIQRDDPVKLYVCGNCLSLGLAATLGDGEADTAHGHQAREQLDRQHARTT